MLSIWTNPKISRLVKSQYILAEDIFDKLIDCRVFNANFRVPHGSVVKCLTHNPGVLGLSHTRSSGFFCGSVLGQGTSEPSLKYW